MKFFTLAFTFTKTVQKTYIRNNPFGEAFGLQNHPKSSPEDETSKLPERGPKQRMDTILCRDVVHAFLWISCDLHLFPKGY